jgi:hypothetical protein
VSLHAQEKINVSLDKNKVFIGDIVKFTVKVQLPQNAQISAAQNFDFVDFDIISSDIRRVSGTENIYELKFNVAAYKTGTLTLNQLAVFYLNSDGTDNLFFTPEAQIEVVSIVGNKAVQDIKDIKALKKLKVKSIYIFLTVIALVLLIICIISVVKAAARLIRKPKQLEIDPKTRALDALSDLYKNRNDVSARIFYYKMSEILRTYASKRYNFNAMEMTTSEFFGKVKTFIPEEINVNEFKNYLKIFNLARYADFTPSKIEIENNYNFTKNLLELL